MDKCYGLQVQVQALVRVGQDRRLVVLTEEIGAVPRGEAHAILAVDGVHEPASEAKGRHCLRTLPGSLLWTRRVSLGSLTTSLVRHGNVYHPFQMIFNCFLNDFRWLPQMTFNDFLNCFQ